VFCSWVSECTRQTWSKGPFLCSCGHLSTPQVYSSHLLSHTFCICYCYMAVNFSSVILHSYSLYPPCRFSSMWTQIPINVKWHLFLQTWVHCVVNSMMEVVSCKRRVCNVPHFPQYRLVALVQSVFLSFPGICSFIVVCSPIISRYRSLLS
jgi:hypothetical protein